MGSYDDYMNSKFDPQKITIAQLREILDTHNVHYTGGERKADLIRKFNKHIRPLIPSLREKKSLASKLSNDPFLSHSVYLSPCRLSIIHVVIFAMLFSFGFAIIYNDEFSNISTNYDKVPRINWFPCPSNAYCSNDKIISCDKGFVLVSSSIPWLKPFTSRCILDNSLARRVKKYTELLKDIAAKETGRIVCETGLHEHLSFQNLLIQLRNQKLVNMDTDQDFELITRIALEHLKFDDNVEVIYKKDFAHKTNIYIISKYPNNFLVCQLRAYLTNKINFCKVKVQEITQQIIGIVLTFSGIVITLIRVFIAHFLSILTLTFIVYVVGKLIYTKITSETVPEIKETEMTILPTYNLEYLWVKNYFHQGLPNRTILGIFKLEMPTELVNAHKSYKRRNFHNSIHRMFHGTRSLCNPQRFIKNSQAKFCKNGCGVCGIAQEVNTFHSLYKECGLPIVQVRHIPIAIPLDIIMDPIRMRTP
ncbi:19027_t:CDS:2, partial [Cetraspora pellucida]